jgi:uncharacterized protein (DUF488 family)
VITIYSIGYGSRNIEEFVSVLKKNEIRYLIDVRSKPYSKYKPEYSKDALKSNLEESGVKYIFMGKNLGGLPDVPSCYTDDGKIDYEAVKTKEFFREGIERVKNAVSQNLRVVLMCSEEKPERCHRSKLIGQVLSNEGVEVLHIDENDQLITQEEVILRLNKKPLPKRGGKWGLRIYKS